MNYLINHLTADLFDDLINLKTLDLTNNPRLIQIDQDLLLGSPLLEYIKLKKCNITQNVPTFPGLFIFILYYQNNVSILYITFISILDSILSINLRDNNIVELNETAFQGLTNLEYLDLSSNPLTTIHNETFIGLINLKTLKLEDVSSLAPMMPTIFTGLVSLISLSLFNNPITTIDYTNFKNLSNAQSGSSITFDP
jgi:Leucine-rich repeat (LRR) protein